MKSSAFIMAVLFAGSVVAVNAQAPAPTPAQKDNPAETEVWKPVPKVVTPGKNFSDAPSDAIILFDGKNLDQWVSLKDNSAAKWPVADGVFTVNKPSGDIATKRSFTDYQ